MNSADICRHRLHHQKISNPQLKTPVEILSWLVAIQAQDYAGAKWSLGLRMQHGTERALEQSLYEKQILRTWLMRGTLHFVAAGDIKWMLALLAPKIITGCARRYKELELDSHTLLKTNDLLEKALHINLSGKTELLAFINEHGISTQGQRAAYILQRASLDGIICQNVLIRNVPNYTLLDFLPETNPKTRSEALAELAKRYFTSRGPATLQDFVWWSGLSVADAKTGLEASLNHLVPVTIHEQTYYLSQNVRSNSQEDTLIHLLPGFDEYLLGYKNRFASLAQEHNLIWCPGNNGMFMPYLVIDGKMAGTWKRTVKKNAVDIEINPFKSPDKKQQKLIEFASGRYRNYLDVPPGSGVSEEK
jgi:hypothetical protein